MSVSVQRDDGPVWAHTYLEPGAIHQLLENRQGGLCARCWEPCPPSDLEAHHRQRRRVLGWCPCNVVGLHRGCHTSGPLAVHAHPEDARQLGLIVPTWESPPEVPVVVRWPWDGRGYLACNGLLVSEWARGVDTDRH